MDYNSNFNITGLYGLDRRVKMNEFQLWFLGFMYGFMGVGVFGSTKKIQDETPMHFIAVFLLWPVLLLMFCALFLCTGKRMHD